MRIDREEFKNRFLIFKRTAMIVVVFLILLLITSIIKGVYSSNIKKMTNQIASFENEIIAANKIVVTDTVFTNIGNVKYDAERCDEDDKLVFKLLKPILSYNDADTYNAALLKFKDSVSTPGINRVFTTIDYKDEDYKTEDEFAGKSRDRYTSLPSSFQSSVVGITDDQYDYVAVVKVTTTEPSGSYSLTKNKTIILTYSVDKNGIIYDSFDAMLSSQLAGL